MAMTQRENVASRTLAAALRSPQRRHAGATDDTAALASRRPKISVVTVVYNGVTEIEQTIQSVIGQTFADIEYIVIDGGSTDGTLSILERYRGEIDVLVSENDAGIYDAMNKGLGLARGHWINFMNCGDYFYDLRVLGDIVPDLRSESAIVAGGYTMFSESGSAGFGASPLRLGKMPSCHQSIFFNALVAKKFPYNVNYKVGADYDVVCRMTRDEGAESIALSPVMVVNMNEVGFASANFGIWLSDYRAVIQGMYGPVKANLWALKALIGKYLPGIARLAKLGRLKRSGL